MKARLREAIAGPWQESFCYAFDAGRWRFVVVGEHKRIKCKLKNFYINGHKGYVNRAGEVMYLERACLEKLQCLLQESAGRLTCVVIHVPLAPIADRHRRAGGIDQLRLLQEIQLRSMVEANDHVKLVLSGHQHFNQVDAIRGQLHWHHPASTRPR